jgi:uroporphyrinogen-III synthase
MTAGMSGLKNKIIAITRSERDAKEFSEFVSEHGGRAIALPTIEIVPRGPEVAKEFLEKLRKEKHDYCAFMSPQAVNVLFDLAGKEEVLPALKSTIVIAVGPKTRQVLQERGVKVGLVPEKFSSAGLVDLLSSSIKKKPAGKKIIIPRSGAANEYAAEALARLGIKVDEILLYTVRTSAITPVWREFAGLLRQKKVDAVIFTSASNVSSFFEIMGTVSAAGNSSLLLQLDKLTKVVSIGPFTSKELERKQVKCFEAEEHTVMGALKLTEQIL